MLTGEAPMAANFFPCLEFPIVSSPNRGGVLCRPFSAPARQQNRDEA